MKVKFIENPWYDDHFDISRESLLLGKTLVAVTRDDHSTLGLSYCLIGWGLYEKFDMGLDLLEGLANGSLEGAVTQQAVSILLAMVFTNLVSLSV